MTENIKNHPEQDQNPSPWDALSEQKPTYQELREKERADAIKELKNLTTEYHNIEKTFRDQLPEVRKKFTDDPEKQLDYIKSFIRTFEGKASYNRFRAKSEANMADLIHLPYALAQYDAPALNYDDERESSIEVQSGLLYRDRLEFLESAIKSTSNDPDHLALLRQTWPKVKDHLYYEHLPISEALEDHKNYDRARTDSHNSMIDQLNDLNDLARSYGTAPFTFRNFKTSKNYDRNVDPDGRLGNLLRSDRSLVQRYFDVAFESAIEKEVAKLEHKNARDFY